MKKKYMAILLAMGMLALTACGREQAETEDTEKNTAKETADAGEEEFELPDYDPVLYEDLTSTILKVGEYRGLEATKATVEVTDEDVQFEIRKVKKNYGSLEDLDGAARNGDVVLIDYTGYVDGETSENLQGTEYSLELGSGAFIPGFEDQLIGAAAGEDREVNVTFPDYYEESMRGKDARFEVHVHKVQSYEVDGWGDDFVKENLEYESVAQMEESIHKELLDTAEEDAESNLEYDLIQALLENCEYDIQQEDVEAYIDDMVSEYEVYASIYKMELEDYLQASLGMTEQQLRELFRETAEFRVKMTITFHEIAKLEGMEVSDEEYEEKVNSLAEEYGYEDGAAVEAAYSSRMIREQMIQEKVIALIRESAVVL